LFPYSFLYKNFAINAIIIKDIEPTLSELKAFLKVAETKVEIDLNRTLETGDFEENQTITRSVNNEINAAMCEDKLTNSQASIILIDENMMTPKQKELNETLRFQSSKLFPRKQFQQKYIHQIGIMADVKKNSDENDVNIHIANEAVFNSNKSEWKDLKISQEESALCIKRKYLQENRRGSDIRNQYRHSSSEECLTENSHACYTVEILDKKRSSTIPSGNSQQAALKDGDNEETEASSNKKPILMLFKRVKRSTLSLSSDDERSNSLWRDNSEINKIANSNLSSYSNPLKQKIVEEDSQDSMHLDRIKKKRHMQVETFVKDNYKFETPDNRLWHQTPLSDISNIAVDDSKLATRKSNQELTKECIPQTDNGSAEKQSAEIKNNIKFSFETIPKSESWYQTFLRQDMNAEFQHSFSENDTKKPFLLPYEIENFHETLMKQPDRIEPDRKSNECNVRYLLQKNPHCHASTSALSTVINKQERQKSSLSDISNIAVDDSKLATRKSSQKLTKKRKPQTDNGIAEKQRLN